MDIAGRLRPLREQVAANPRLQTGLVLIGIIVLAWLFLVLGDWRLARLAELEQAHDRLEQVKQLANQHEWPERAAEARQLADLLEAEIPEAASPGLAQADFQGWLRELDGGQPDSIRLDVQAPVAMDNPAGVVRVTAVISGALAPSSVVQMIQRIEGRSNLATIPMMTLRSDGLNRTFSITVQGYYRLAVREDPQ